MEEQNLEVYFGTRIANLYDVGYLATDIQQLIAFSEMVNEADAESIEKYFGEKTKGLNRFAKPLERYGKSSEITDVRKGSLALILSGMAVAATIIVPIAIAKVQRQLEQEGLETTFEISPEDENIKTHINAYASGQYGTGIDALNYLFEMLSRLNYNTTVVAEHVYRIEDVTDKYAGRMVKTIKRNVGNS
ncbi:hypothetical protein [Alcanivorax sp.]|uniref:hypothetical protein n=1 Tax=Alcanivorax sp. TaxID=1872427 RepID=UPI003A90E10B